MSSMSEKKLSKREMVAEINNRGVIVWDAMVILDQVTGEMLGYEKYGDPSTAHAELDNDDNILFIIHAPHDDSPEDVTHH